MLLPDVLLIFLALTLIVFVIFMLYALNEDWIFKRKSETKFSLFLSSIKPTDQIKVTISYSNEYRMRVYCMLNSKFLSMGYEDLNIHNTPKECEIDDVVKIINYIYTVTGIKIEILDFTTQTKVVTDKVKLLNKNKVAVIENKSSDLLDEYGDSIKLNKLD